MGLNRVLVVILQQLHQTRWEAQTLLMGSHKGVDRSCRLSTACSMVDHVKEGQENLKRKIKLEL